MSAETNRVCASGIRGIASHRRRGRWLELDLADGRLVAFDPIDVVGCEASAVSTPAPAHDEPSNESITIYLRGRESEHITDVDARALWSLITEAR